MTCIYVIGAKDGPVKIGFTDKPFSRLATIRTASPVTVEMQGAFDVGNLHREMERTVHLVLRNERAAGEWFEVTAAKALAAVYETANLVGLVLKPAQMPHRHNLKNSDYDYGKARPVGRPPDGKERVTLRLDPDVVDRYRATGKGWQARINDDLRRMLKL